MAAFDYDLAYTKVMGLIDKFGQEVTITKPAVIGGYDNLGNSIPDVPAVDVFGKMSPLLNYSSNSMASSYEVNGEKLIAGDKFSYFDAQQPAEIGMTFTFDNVKWRIQSMSKLTSLDNVSVLNKLQLRKG